MDKHNKHHKNKPQAVKKGQPQPGSSLPLEPAVIPVEANPASKGKAKMATGKKA